MVGYVYIHIHIIYFSCMFHVLFVNSLCENIINVCGMRYMSRHEKAETVFRAVKTLLNDMNELEYDSVKRMVVHLRECMELLFFKGCRRNMGKVRLGLRKWSGGVIQVITWSF